MAFRFRQKVINHYDYVVFDNIVIFSSEYVNEVLKSVLKLS